MTAGQTERQEHFQIGPLFRAVLAFPPNPTRNELVYIYPHRLTCTEAVHGGPHKQYQKPLATIY